MAKQIVTKTLESGAKVSSIGTVKSVIGVVTASEVCTLADRS